MMILQGLLHPRTYCRVYFTWTHSKTTHTLYLSQHHFPDRSSHFAQSSNYTPLAEPYFPAHWAEGTGSIMEAADMETSHYGNQSQAILMVGDHHDHPMCRGLQPGPPSQTPGGLGQRYWSVMWSPDHRNLEFLGWGSSGPSSLMHALMAQGSTGWYYSSNAQRFPIFSTDPSTSNTDVLVQDCSNSGALAMELLQSCTKPLIFSHHSEHFFKYLRWSLENSRVYGIFDARNRRSTKMCWWYVSTGLESLVVINIHMVMA